MIVKRKLIPGEAGTKRWIEKYGEDLLCVRYRYDEKHKRKITTVEIIADKGIWEKNPQKIPKSKIMRIRVDYGEISLAKLVKAAGGRWNKQIKLWELPYGEVLTLGLEKRIVKISNKNKLINKNMK